MGMKAIFVLLVIIGLTACSSTSAPTPGETAGTIGIASMPADRMITVILRAQNGKSSVGNAAFFMNPDHKDYQKTIQHVGGLKPGQSKPYPAWPEKG